MFHFDPDKFNFWPVYNTIQHFYPIGIDIGQEKVYHSYKGQLELRKLITDNIHNVDKFAAEWTTFCATASQALGLKIISTTMGMAPSFSGYAELANLKNSDFTQRRELHFFISLLGPYFTILELFSSSVQLDNKNYPAINAIAVSPRGPYASKFESLEKLIRSKFQQFKFIPHMLFDKTLNGLDVGYEHGSGNTVFAALFNNTINTETPVIGDRSYNVEEWAI